MTRRKSGSLLAMACEVGAALASDDQQTLETFRSFGTHLGVVAQLLNDLVGVDPSLTAEERGTDLRRRKKSLPVAYALRCAREEAILPVLEWYARPAGDAGRPGEEERVVQVMSDLGALHYAWVVADAHRREALADLRRLEALIGPRGVKRLRRLVPATPARAPANHRT
jgi:geranylgeranyl diphosphate synthase type I